MHTYEIGLYSCNTTAKLSHLATKLLSFTSCIIFTIQVSTDKKNFYIDIWESIIMATRLKTVNGLFDRR
jgi:hypothetical protein